MQITAKSNQHGDIYTGSLKVVVEYMGSLHVLSVIELCLCRVVIGVDDSHKMLYYLTRYC